MRSYSAPLIPEIATPATPPTGTLAVYAKSDGVLYSKNDGGTEVGYASQSYVDTHDVFLNAADYLIYNNGTTLNPDASVTALLSAWSSSGKPLYFPPGTYLINGGIFSVPANNLTMFGAGRQRSVIKQNSNGYLLDASGTSTGMADQAGTNRRWYFNMSDLTLHGNDTTGSVFRTYYGSQFRINRVLFYGKIGYGLDSVELWDSCFIDTEWEWIQSATEPVISISASRAASGFGSSTDNPNAIRFFDTRIETFKNTAIRIESGTQTGLGPHDIQFFGTKIETGINRATPMLYVGGDVFEVVFEGVYMHIANWDSGYSTGVNMIDWFPLDQGALKDVWLTNANVANLVWLGVALGAGTRTVLDNVTGRYAAAPGSAHLNFLFAGINADIRGCATNLGNLFAGTLTNYVSSPTIQLKKMAIDPAVSGAPTAAAGANAGTSPPAPVVNSASRDQRGSVTFGTGSGSPAAGTYCTITFNSAWATAPFVALTPLNSTTVNLKPYIVSVSTTTLVIGFQTAGTASQANTTYAVSWVAIG